VAGALLGVGGLGAVLALDQLDDVEARVRAHHLRHLADLQRGHRVDEQFGQAADRAQADGAALVARVAVVGVLLDQLREVEALGCALLDLHGLGLQELDLGGRGLFGHGDQDVR
jgi:hypothetical protein